MLVKISNYPQLVLVQDQQIGCGAGWIYCSVCGRETATAVLDEIKVPFFTSREDAEFLDRAKPCYLLVCPQCRESQYKVVGEKICSIVPPAFS